MTGVGHDSSNGSAKKSKPAMEKRRRARINASLLELRDLIPETKQRLNKMEKADILEMTVKHIKRLQETNKSLEKNYPSSRSYSLGFDECTQEVSEFFHSSSPFTSELKINLLNHLRKCAPHNPPDSPSSSPSKATTTVTTPTTSEPQVSTTTTIATTNTLRHASVADSILSRCLLSTYPTTSSNVVKSCVSLNLSSSGGKERKNMSTPIAVSSTSDDGPNENGNNSNNVNQNVDERSHTPQNSVPYKIPPPVKSVVVQNTRSFCDLPQSIIFNANSVKRDLLNAFREENNNIINTTQTLNDANNNINYDVCSLKQSLTNDNVDIQPRNVSKAIVYLSDSTRQNVHVIPVPHTNSQQPRTYNSIESGPRPTESDAVIANDIGKPNKLNNHCGDSTFIPSEKQNNQLKVIAHINNRICKNCPPLYEDSVSRLTVLCQSENNEASKPVNSETNNYAIHSHQTFVQSCDMEDGPSATLDREMNKSYDMVTLSGKDQPETEAICLSNNIDLQRKLDSNPTYLIPIYIQTAENQSPPTHQAVVVNQTPVITPTNQATSNTRQVEEATSLDCGANSTQLKSPRGYHQGGEVHQFEFDSDGFCRPRNSNPSGVKRYDNDIGTCHRDGKQFISSLHECENDEPIRWARKRTEYIDNITEDLMPTPLQDEYEGNIEWFDEEVTPVDTYSSSLRHKKAHLALCFDNQGSCCTSDDECHESGHSTSDGVRQSNGRDEWVWGYSSYDSEDEDSMSGPTDAKRIKQVPELSEQKDKPRSRHNSFAKRLGEFRLRQGSLSQYRNLQRWKTIDSSGIESTPKAASTFNGESQRLNLNDKFKFHMDAPVDTANTANFRRRCYTYSQRPGHWHGAEYKNTINNNNNNNNSNDLLEGVPNLEKNTVSMMETGGNIENNNKSNNVLNYNARDFLTARRRCATVSAQDLRWKKPVIGKIISEVPETREVNDKQNNCKLWEINDNGYKHYSSTLNINVDENVRVMRKRCSTFSSPGAYTCGIQSNKAGSSRDNLRLVQNNANLVYIKSDNDLTDKTDAFKKSFENQPSETRLEAPVVSSNSFESGQLSVILEQKRKHVPSCVGNEHPNDSVILYPQFTNEHSNSMPSFRECQSNSTQLGECSVPLPVHPHNMTIEITNLQSENEFPISNQPSSDISRNRDHVTQSSDYRQSRDSGPLNLSTKSRRFSVEYDGDTSAKLGIDLQNNANSTYYKLDGYSKNLTAVNSNVDQSMLHRPRSWSVSSGMSSLTLNGYRTKFPPNYDDDENVWRPW